MGICGLETLVCFVQCYVFYTLWCMYMQSSLFLLLLFIFLSRVRCYFLLACFLVVHFILNFSRFYMNTSVSPGYFNMLYSGFFTFMVFMLHGHSWYLFFLGWEMMG